MIRFHVPTVVYDTGVLVAAERDDRRMSLLHKEVLDSDRRVVVPAPVLTQAWRGGAGRQVSLSLLLRGCDIEATTEQTAKAAGVLLGACGMSDAIDAIVVATAIRLKAPVFTSDPTDLRKLIDAVDAKVPLIVV
jgi:hypothetical protein